MPDSDRRDPAAGDLFEKFTADQKLATPSKTGCWTVFVALMLILIAIATLVVRLRYR